MPPVLASRRSAQVSTMLLALCPNIILTTAFTLISPSLVRELHGTAASLMLAEGLSNAGYAFGAVLGAQVGRRWGQRYALISYEAVFLVGSVVALLAGNVPAFFVGRLLQGVATGLMLVAALPQLVTGAGVRALPATVAIVNVGLFGATVLGPIIGGVVATGSRWHWLFAFAALAGLCGLVMSALGDRGPDSTEPELPVDRSALLLAAAATFLPFFATGALSSFSSPVFWLPFGLGLLALALLLGNQLRAADPLLPVRVLTSQLPVTGTLVAMIAGAVVVTDLQIAERGLVAIAVAPTRAGLLFWPLLVGMSVAALAFGVLFRTRYVPLLVNAGLVCLVGATLVLLVGRAQLQAVVPYAAALMGFGAGAAVSPGMFLAGLAVPTPQLGRALAMVQLLRLEAAYAVSPIVLLLVTENPDPPSGQAAGLLVVLSLGVAGVLAALLIPLLSGARLRRPDLQTWLDGDGPALPSPATAAEIRPGDQQR